MSLSAGARIGPYEILSAIGAGGMGEVYRARDTRLKREVALKVLPEHFTADPDRLARFQREAEVLASLNHPHIAHIHGLEESDGGRALVLEFVDGPTLDERIAQGRVSLEEALSIAKQIVDALEAAHEQGIIHRDLKPANVKLRPDGMVKVLDFGLAKALEPSTAVGMEATLSPTITSPAMTRMGVILGTAAYMSPEQAKGRAADNRSDVWAFGCLLYEMLTAKRAFEGEDIAETLAFVLTKDPDWTVLPANTSPPVRTLLRRCLEKDRKKRLADIADARFELDEALAAIDKRDGFGAAPRTATLEKEVRRGRRRRLAVWTVGGLVAAVSLALGGFAVWTFSRSAARPAPVRFVVLPPERNVFTAGSGFLSVSPDGRRLAFITGTTRAENRLWVRPLGSFNAQPIPGTESAMNPVWSPDGRYLAFTAGLTGLGGGRLRKVDVNGGPPLTLADSGVAGAGAWSGEGVILFTGADGRIHRVGDDGGEATPVTDLDGTRQETRHVPGFFLSDGRRFVFQAQNRDGSKSTLYLASLESSSRTRLLDGLSSVAYANGYLIYQREGTLMVQPFDDKTGHITGSASPIVEDVDYDTLSGRASFAVSSNGVLVYRSAVGAGSSVLTWFTREGKPLASVALPGNYQGSRRPALSPDGHYLGVTRAEGSGKTNVWLIDLERNVPDRFTLDSAADTPVWSPDGGRVVFASSRSGVADLYQRDPRHAGTDELLYASSDHKRPQAFSPDGKVLLFGQSPLGTPEIWALPMTGERKPIPIVKTGFPAGYAVFSPDGRWFAYCEGDSGGDQVYAQPYPPNGTRVRVSSTSGSSPQWSTDGKKVLYVTVENHIMTVDVAVDGSTLRVGIPQQLFVAPATFLHRSLLFDSSRSRLLLPVSREAEAAPPINVVVNWFEELKRYAVK